jgi:NitT/TauT family transport system permease protein
LFCRLPAAVPAILGGIKVALPLSLIGAVLGEFLGGDAGLGYIIVSSGSAFRVDRIFAAIVMLAIGGVATVTAVDCLRVTLLGKFHQA